MPVIELSPVAKTILGVFWVAAIFAFVQSAPALGILICLSIVAIIALLAAVRLGAGNVPPVVQGAVDQAFAHSARTFGALGLTLAGAALGLAAGRTERAPALHASAPTSLVDAGVPAPEASKLTPWPDASEPSDVPPPLSTAALEERFRSMTPAQHVAAARASLSFGCPPREASTVRLDEAARHFGALTPRMQRGRDGRAITDTIARCMASRMGPELRDGMANTLATRLAAAGIEVSGAIATGTDKLTVRIISPQCSRAMAAAIARTYGASLRGVHFQLVECQTPGFFSGDTFAAAL